MALCRPLTNFEAKPKRQSTSQRATVKVDLVEVKDDKFTALIGR
jgi:hypothetical protein